jgi:NADH dehydrogenase
MPPEAARRYLLTGASGYIGSRLLERLLEGGAEVVVLGSAPLGAAPSARLSVIPWRLGEDVPERAFAAAGGSLWAVIHLAHDWNTREGDDERNRLGTGRLLAAARANDVCRFVFVSSLSARPEALNRYGRIKAEVETLLRPPSEVACRVGLVYGGPRRGMYGTLLRLTRLAVLPMVDAGQPVQPIHLDELCLGLMHLADRRELDRPVYALAADAPIAFAGFLKLLARKAHGRAPVLIAVPRAIALLLADLSAALPGVPGVDRERLLGLAGISTRPTAADLREVGVDVRPVAEVLGESELRRQLREAFALLSYCSGAAVGPATLRLYVRSLRRLGEAAPLALPPWASACPGTLRLYEAAAQSQAPLRRRLLLAARVAEASGEPPGRFHMLTRRPAPLVALVLLWQGLLEGCLLCLRAIRRAGKR